MDICKEMAVDWWVVDEEMVLQLGNGIDGSWLGSTINVFTIFRALCVGYLEDCHVMAVTVSSGPNIRALDVHCGVKAIKRGDRKFSSLDQGEEGGGKA